VCDLEAGMLGLEAWPRGLELNEAKAEANNTKIDKLRVTVVVFGP